MGVAYNPSIITDGLLLAVDAANIKSYPGSGSIWNDLSGNGRHGTFAGSPTFSNQTNSFDGTNWTTFADDTELDFLNRLPMTYEVFCKPTQVWPNTSWRGLIDRESNPGSGRDGYTMWLSHNTSSGAWYFRLERFTEGTQIGPIFSISQSDVLNKFHHIVGTYDGTLAKIYHNTVLKQTVTNTNNVTNTSQTTSIGTRNGTYQQSGFTSGNAFIGEIPIARIYNKALSASEVKQNFEASRSRVGL